MTKRLDYLKTLLAKTEQQLEEIRISSHPFRAQFVTGWDARLVAVRANIADEERRV